jgi:hypothetical protein
MGTVRVQIREHTSSTLFPHAPQCSEDLADLITLSYSLLSFVVVDTHPTSLASLRIDQPFPALLDCVNSIDFESLDSMDHGNIPFVLILVKALEDWRKSVRRPADSFLSSSPFSPKS